jgi:hypothetical protein
MKRHREKPKKAGTTKGKSNMTNQNNHYKTLIAALFMALAFACPSLLMAQEQEDNDEDGGAIVGLWHENYVSNFGPPFETYTQWHSDGLEIETPNFLNGVCMGTFKNVGARTFKLFHVGWTPGGIPPAPASVRFELRELNTVNRDRNSFDGNYDQKFFDANGNLVAEDSGTIHATRLSVRQFADQASAAAIK